MIITNATVVSAEYKGEYQLKTRIISGFAAAAIVAGLLYLNSFFPITVVISLAVLAALATYEMMNNTGCITNKAATFTAMAYSAAVQFAYNGIFFDAAALTVIYVLAVVGFIVFDHKNFGDRQITMALAMPILMSYAFASLERIINVTDSTGLFCFVMLLVFACGSDIFAYFVGSAIGKHKLAPAISPKKTIEGAIGGLVGATLLTVSAVFIFEAILGVDIKLWLFVAVTPVFGIVGMLGDLVASAIKRNYGIKDYGNIMPGHGGILDRMDSVLLVAPAFALFLNYFSVV